MPQFDSSVIISQLFWLTIFFSFLYIIVTKYIAPNISSILSKRDEYIKDNIKRAKYCQEKIDGFKYQKSLNKTEIYEEVKELELQALKYIDEIYISKKQQIKNNIKSQTNQIFDQFNKEKNNLQKEQKNHVIDSAAYIITKISNVNPDVNKLSNIYESLLRSSS